MNILRRFKQLERKYAWTFIGLTLSVVFGLLGFYASFLYEKTPQLRYEIMSSFNVLEVREDVAELSVLLNGERLDQEEHPLRVVTLRLVNDGSASVLKGHYDTSQPWGFRVTGATVIDVEVLDANSRYLRTQSNPTLHPDNSISFDYLILDPGKYVALKLLLLLDSSAPSLIVPMGKIAGVDDVPVINLTAGVDDIGVWSGAFRGNMLTQTLRLLLYPIGLFFLMALFSFFVVFPISMLFERRRLKKRRKVIEVFKMQPTPEAAPSGVHVVYDFYVDHGLAGVRYVLCLLKHPSELREQAELLPTMITDRDFYKERVRSLHEEHFWSFPTLLSSLFEHGLLTREGADVIPHPDFEQWLDCFAAFAKTSG